MINQLKFANLLKCLFPLLGMVLMSVNGMSQQPKFEWVGTIGQPGGNPSYNGTTVEKIAIDSNKWVYTVGHFVNTVDFDYKAGVYNMTSSGNTDAYIAKHDTAGVLQWAHKIGGSDWDYAHQVATDKNGNVYMVGVFQGTVDLDPGPGSFTLTSNGANTFLIKLDSKGVFQWARTWLMNHFYELDIDIQGNILLSGDFSGTKDFDPGAGIVNQTATNNGLFALKLDNAGNFTWVKHFVNTGGATHDLSSLDTDVEGNVFIAGRFTLTEDFDPGSGTFNLTSSGDFDAFVVKLSPAGNFSWAIRIEISGNNGL